MQNQAPPAIPVTVKSLLNPAPEKKAKPLHQPIALKPPFKAPLLDRGSSLERDLNNPSLKSGGGSSHFGLGQQFTALPNQQGSSPQIGTQQRQHTTSMEANTGRTTSQYPHQPSAIPVGSTARKNYAQQLPPGPISYMPVAVPSHANALRGHADKPAVLSRAPYGPESRSHANNQLPSLTGVAGRSVHDLNWAPSQSDSGGNHPPQQAAPNPARQPLARRGNPSPAPLAPYQTHFALIRSESMTNPELTLRLRKSRAVRVYVTSDSQLAYHLLALVDVVRAEYKANLMVQDFEKSWNKGRRDPDRALHLVVQLNSMQWRSMGSKSQEARGRPIMWAEHDQGGKKWFLKINSTLKLGEDTRLAQAALTDAISYRKVAGPTVPPRTTAPTPSRQSASAPAYAPVDKPLVPPQGTPSATAHVPLIETSCKLKSLKSGETGLGFAQGPYIPMYSVSGSRSANPLPLLDLFDGVLKKYQETGTVQKYIQSAGIGTGEGLNGEKLSLILQTNGNLWRVYRAGGPDSKAEPIMWAEYVEDKNGSEWRLKINGQIDVPDKSPLWNLRASVPVTFRLRPREGYPQGQLYDHS